nr:MAG TPA: hypothetical protein [Caudoviricetes sp.]
MHKIILLKYIIAYNLHNFNYFDYAVVLMTIFYIIIIFINSCQYLFKKSHYNRF